MAATIKTTMTTETGTAVTPITIPATAPSGSPPSVSEVGPGEGEAVTKTKHLIAVSTMLTKSIYKKKYSSATI